MTRTLTGGIEQLIADAQALLDRVQTDLRRSHETLGEMGIDPAKVPAVLERFMGPMEKADLARQIAADQAAIEQEIAENIARARASTPSSTGKKRRAMV